MQTKILKFDDNQELDYEPTGVFIDKSVLLDNTLKIQITELSEGTYGKNIKFKIVDTGEEFLMDLNKTNYNWLLTHMGKTVSSWMKPLWLSGEEFETTNKKGDLLKGIKVSFSKSQPEEDE